MRSSSHLLHCWHSGYLRANAFDLNWEKKCVGWGHKSTPQLLWMYKISASCFGATTTHVSIRCVDKKYFLHSIDFVCSLQKATLKLTQPINMPTHLKLTQIYCRSMESCRTLKLIFWIRWQEFQSGMNQMTPCNCTNDIANLCVVSMKHLLIW